MTFELPRPPLPPFTFDTATLKVRAAENAWNGKKPEQVALAYSPNSQWRNRNEFFSGRNAIEAFLTRKWQQEHQYRLIKELWAFNDNRIAVRFAYEWHNEQGQWFRSYGNENWQFDDLGYMTQRHASINDLAILPEERKLTWTTAVRPEDYPSLTFLGL